MWIKVLHLSAKTNKQTPKNVWLPNWRQTILKFYLSELQISDFYYFRCRRVLFSDILCSNLLIQFFAFNLIKILANGRIFVSLKRCYNELPVDFDLQCCTHVLSRVTNPFYSFYRYPVFLIDYKVSFGSKCNKLVISRCSLSSHIVCTSSYLLLFTTTSRSDRLVQVTQLIT